MPIRFLFPIIIAVALLIGVRAKKSEEVVQTTPSEVVEDVALKTVIESPKQEVVSPPQKTVVVKPVPKPVVQQKPAQKPITPQTPGLTSYESELLVLINNYRAEHGLGLLASNTALYNLAKEHSDEMANKKELSHDGFQSRFDRASRLECAENVGWNYFTPAAQLEGWKKSPPHNEALLNAQITIAGIAQSGTYVTFFACQ